MQKPRTRIQITSLRREHLDELVELETLCFPRDQSFERCDFAAMIGGKPYAGLCEVAICNGIAGYWCGAVSVVADMRVLWIDSIAVHPSTWRRGIGAELVESALRKAESFRKVSMVCTSMTPECPEAVRFLLCQGFVRDNRRGFTTEKSHLYSISL